VGTEGCRGAHAHIGRGAYLIMMKPLGCVMSVSMDETANRVKRRSGLGGEPGPVVATPAFAFAPEVHRRAWSWASLAGRMRNASLRIVKRRCDSPRRLHKWPTTTQGHPARHGFGGTPPQQLAVSCRHASTTPAGSVGAPSTSPSSKRLACYLSTLRMAAHG
jgi:hypothetical protein